MPLDDVAPKYGGRNVASAHGLVTKKFSRHFVPGANGCTIQSMKINGVAITLADFGLDEPVTAPVCYIGKEGDNITEVQLSAGDAWFHWALPEQHAA